VTPATVVGAAPTSTFSSTVHTVPIGVVMVVQPNIDVEKERITLALRPTVSSAIGTGVPDPSINLNLASACGAGNTSVVCTEPITSNIPVVQVREMDSVVTVDSGDVIVMGGLMQSQTSKQDQGVPGAGDLPLVGNLFKAKNDQTNVTELVIFLKATLVHGVDSVDWADKDLYQRYMQDPHPLAF
jgi:general secretion pathway protein D